MGTGQDLRERGGDEDGVCGDGDGDGRQCCRRRVGMEDSTAGAGWGRGRTVVPRACSSLLYTLTETRKHSLIALYSIIAQRGRTCRLTDPASKHLIGTLCNNSQIF